MDLELHYQFKQPQLCRRAFIHSSYAHEHPEEQADNEVLEFLGDACLNCFVTLYLCQMFPSYTEGELSALRAHCVDQKACYDYAHALQLPQSLLLGKGEQKNRNNRSIVAALFEALLGAIILDGGYAQAMLWFQDHVLSLIVKRLDSFQQDYKRVLQEKLQQQFHCLPRYVVISEQGPDHDKEFKVAVFLKEKMLGEGRGSSKKQAESMAAYHALQQGF